MMWLPFSIDTEQTVSLPGSPPQPQVQIWRHDPAALLPRLAIIPGAPVERARGSSIDIGGSAAINLKTS
jgi:hypothetical protein